MKKLMLVAASFILAANVNAQVAVVDTQYVFENAKITKKVNEQILELTKQAKEKIKSEESSLSKKQEKLKSQKAVLSSDVYAQKEEALKQAIIAFRKSFKEIQKDLNLKNKEKKQEIAEKISQAVDTIAKEKGYDAVISKTFIMYNKESIEITDQVLKELNK
ncbi:MAG TPA: hypothetical protein DCL21_01050 [Alphaproteobacteria bacterium]|nr:hypothetical protein [Alphaproteobacteria bacterium]